MMEWRREREWGEKRDVRKRMDGTVVEIVRNDGKYADRQTDTQTNRYTDRQIHRQTDRYTDRQTDRYTDRQTDRYTDRQTDRQAPIVMRSHR